METPFFLKNDSYNLFSVLHEPENKTTKLTAFVFCAPFAEEKLITHRVLVNLARAITNQGFYSLRFDYMGHGDSDGNFQDATVETRISDIAAAVNFLKTEKNIDHIILIGIRFGATLAALMQTKLKNAESLILVNPVLNGKDYIDQVLRTNLTLQMATYKKIIKNRDQIVEEIMQGQPANIDGYQLTKQMYEQISAIDLFSNSEYGDSNIFILEISNREGKPIDKNLQRFADHISPKLNTFEIEGIKEFPFWKDEKFYRAKAPELENKITQWLEKHY